MIQRINLKSIFLISLIILSGILRLLVPYFPYKVEFIYSLRIYKIIGQALSSFTGIIPFSLGEFIVIFSFLFAIFFIIYITGKLYYDSSNPLVSIYNYSKKIIITIGIAYLLFIILWGLNYHRLPFSKFSGLETSPASKEELKELCIHLINKTNYLRNQVDENKNGIMIIKGGYRDIFKRSNIGYEMISKIYDGLGGNYGIPKRVLFSKGLSYLGISGIYFPFTGEANVNVDIPDFMIPCTTSHEMAHQRGFAREDEANYIAYLTCSIHPHEDFQYSGHLLALIHSMNTMYKYDKELYRALMKEYSKGVKRDLKYLNNYWDSFEGPIEETHTKINNAYLKANDQKDGVQSYGRMVDLLIAEHRLRKKKHPSFLE